YFRQVDEHRDGLEYVGIPEWHLLPGFVAAMADQVREAQMRFPVEARGRVPVIFTAHSLPSRILESGDPYPGQLAASVRAIAERLGNGSLRHHFAYQSAALT